MIDTLLEIENMLVKIQPHVSFDAYNRLVERVNKKVELEDETMLLAELIELRMFYFACND